MSWELFTEKKYSFGNPKITVLVGGGMLLNKSCVDEYIKDTKYLALYYNADKRMIGIKPTNEKDIYTYEIDKKKDVSGKHMSAISFFKKYKIDYKNMSKRAYSASWDEKEGMIVISLEG